MIIDSVYDVHQNDDHAIDHDNHLHQITVRIHRARVAETGELEETQILLEVDKSFCRSLVQISLKFERISNFEASFCSYSIL